MAISLIQKIGSTLQMMEIMYLSEQKQEISIRYGSSLKTMMAHIKL